MKHLATVFAMSYAQQAAQAPAAPASPPAPSANQVGEQIRETIRAAQEAAQDAARDAQRAEAQARGEAGGGGRGGGRVITVGPVGPSGPRFSVQDGGPGFGGRYNSEGIPSGVVDISLGFFVMCAVMVIGWPLARALGKRVERRGDTAVVAPAMADQLHRIEQAVEAMSIEVERISESQRFIARLQNERLPQAADRA